MNKQFINKIFNMTWLKVDLPMRLFGENRPFWRPNMAVIINFEKTDRTGYDDVVGIFYPGWCVLN